jgi:hypothetical protein
MKDALFILVVLLLFGLMMFAIHHENRCERIKNAGFMKVHDKNHQRNTGGFYGTSDRYLLLGEFYQIDSTLIEGCGNEIEVR